MRRWNLAATSVLALTAASWPTVCAHASTSLAHLAQLEMRAGRQTVHLRPDSREARRSVQLSQRRSPVASPLLISITAALRGGAANGRQVAHERQPTALRRRMKICTLFALSYICSVGFNVNNKRALMLVPLPWTYASLNLLVGSAVSLVSWCVKAAPWPRITMQDARVLVPMGFLHAVSHVTVVLGLGAGAVSFAQTVKASEACFTALLSFLFLGQTLPLPVYLTLLPVVAGVGITSCNQIRFRWLALLSGLLSNFSNALRNVLIVKNIGPAAARGKASLSSRGGSTGKGTDNISVLASTPAGVVENEGGLGNLAPGDTYRLLTVVGGVLLFPVAACFEHAYWPRFWQGAVDAISSTMLRSLPLRADFASAQGPMDGVAAAARGDWAEAFRRALISGVCFNLFYDLTFRLLGQLHPVTHAVGNTVKRIVVIGAGAAVFGGDLGGARGAMGSALAVIGVLGYSVAKARCSPKPAANQN